MRSFLARIASGSGRSLFRVVASCLVAALFVAAFIGVQEVNAQQRMDERSWLERAAINSNPITGLYYGLQDVGARLGDAAWDSTPQAARTVVNGLTRDMTAEQIARESLNVPSTATITDTLTARLVGFIAFMMGVIVSFLGKVILLLINVLLGFLTYNGFADAPPVVVGWRMVRDLANMFFIVILILASYGTILGWRTNELHVKNILPKVLMAAVLVNFSKTIVALLIDASQVVMLTFVNAFASIGAGNFTNALHLPLITTANYASRLQGLTSATSSAAQSVATNGAGQVILDVIIASALQIFLLVVAIGVMLMMVVFVVGRIVGLWMLLIFSPIPFLASALPGSMKNVLGSQAGKYWGQLSGLLTGGPVMAFWLWLTFATLSAQGQDERLGLFQNTQAADAGTVFNGAMNATSMFMSAIGNAQGLGSYLIAIAMMMMGLQAAIDAAGSLNSAGVGGGLMKSIADKTKKYAQKAALYGAGGGVLAGGYMAARGAGWAAGGFAGAVDRRHDVRGRVAGGVRKWVPFAGQNKWLREQQFKNRIEANKKAGEINKMLDESNATQDEKDAERSIQRGAFDWRRLTGDRNAIDIAERQELSKRANDPKAYDKQFSELKDANKGELKGLTNDDVISKRLSDRIAKSQSSNEAIKDLERQKALITGSTIADLKEKESIDEKIKSLRKANPNLAATEEDRQKQLKDVRQNWATLDADAKTNFDVLRSVASEGAFKESTNSKGEKTLTLGSNRALEETRNRLSGKDRENFDAMVQHIQESGEMIGGKFVANGLTMDRLKNMSIEQDANFNSRVVELGTDSTGKVDVDKTGFRESDRKQFAIKGIQDELSSDSIAAWGNGKAPDGTAAMHGVGTHAGAEQRFMQSVQTVGIQQAMANVGGSVVDGKWVAGDPAKSPSTQMAREAAMGQVRSYVSDKMSDATRTMNAKTDYTDADGNKVEKTRAEMWRDGKAPSAVKDKIYAEYQDSIREVMPVLKGASELDDDQQLALLSAMAQGGVAESLNESMMTDKQREILGDVRKMGRKMSDSVEEWFSQKNADADGQKYLSDMAALGMEPEADRNKKLAGSDTLRKQYQEYVDHTNARNAISQLNKGASSQGRNRKGGGKKGKGKGKGKGGGGGGGGAPAGGGGGGGTP